MECFTLLATLDTQGEALRTVTLQLRRQNQKLTEDVRELRLQVRENVERVKRGERPAKLRL